jgi:hypothetical protein
MRMPSDRCGQESVSRSTHVFSGWAILNKKAVAIEDIYLDDRIPQDAYRPTFVKSLVMVPIRATETIGAIGNY